ncbi:MAG: hypothetical protein AAB610_01225 [Patescibacteria group bacterium]
MHDPPILNPVQTVAKFGSSLAKMRVQQPFPTLASLGSFDKGLSIIAILTGRGEQRAVNITDSTDYSRHSHLASQPGCTYAVEIFSILTSIWNEAQGF